MQWFSHRHFPQRPHPSTCPFPHADIGTSPLYAFASVFPDGAPGDDPKRTLGGFSIMFWTMTVLVLLKYVLIVLAANDHGEGEMLVAFGVGVLRARRGVHAGDYHAVHGLGSPFHATPAMSPVS